MVIFIITNQEEIFHSHKGKNTVHIAANINNVFYLHSFTVQENILYILSHLISNLLNETCLKKYVHKNLKVKPWNLREDFQLRDGNYYYLLVR